VLADDQVSQKRIDEAVEELDLAIQALIEVEDEIPEPKPVDKSALEKAVEKAADLKKADYTEESWESFEKILSQANNILTDEAVKQAEVDKVLIALEKAMDNLVEKEEEVNKPNKPEKPESPEDPDKPEKPESPEDPIIEDEQTKEDDDNELPHTATNIMNWAVVGAFVILLGLIGLVLSRRKQS